MGMDVAPVSALTADLLISSHFFSPFVKDNVLYFFVLLCILLRILMLQLDYSNLYFLCPVNFSNFTVHKSLCWPSVLARVHDCQFSCFIAYQETVKVSKIIVSCLFLLGVVSLFSKHWPLLSAALMLLHCPLSRTSQITAAASLPDHMS